MNVLQLSIMRIVDLHSHREKRPVTLKQIVFELGEETASKEAIKYAIRALIKSGFLRKSVARSNEQSYVQLRSLSC